MTNPMKQPSSWADRKLAALKSSHEDPDRHYTFETSCVGASGEDINEMLDHWSHEEVTYDEMSKHCDLSAFEAELGYGPDIGLELKDDTMVSFWKSRYRGKRCYYLDHSRIEYIWVERMP
jgi:hypothetical protein